METSTEKGKVLSTKKENYEEETQSPPSANKESTSHSDCTHAHKYDNRLTADNPHVLTHSQDVHNVGLREKKSSESENNGCQSNAPALESKIDAATMTELVSDSDSLFDQDAASKSSCFAVAAMIPAPSAWHSFAGLPSSAMAEYLSRLPASTLPLTLHHFLKYSAATNEDTSLSAVNTALKEEDGLKNNLKRKDHKQPSFSHTSQLKSDDMHLTSALDGSMLFCCPECHMAYPEKELLQQHLIVHHMERRFVCDICGAGLKRKEHLDRHKQGHNPDRPYTCTVCLKAFKRNEHLSRHFITHSGDKSQICIECGKGFYRKDHLLKHAQSHIAKRLRTEFYGKKSDISSPLSSSDESSVVLMSGTPTLPILSS